MSPADIIKHHREYLMRRVVSRNSLLRFRPGPQSGRVDVYKMFPESTLLEPTLFEESGDDRDIPSDFLKKIFGCGAVSEHINQVDNIARRLRNLKKTAEDNRRTFGQWTLVLAWPFVYVPTDKLEGATTPLFAPLFLWRIKISKITPHQATFELLQDDNKSECELNFVLAEYLKAKGDFELPEEGDIVTKLQNTNNLEGQVKEIQKWLGKTDINILGELNESLMLYSDPPANQPTLHNVAVLGNAHFKYLALFRDLEKLETMARDGKDLGLLSYLFRREQTAVAEDIQPPSEKDRWFVETTDQSQEEVVWKSRTSNVPIIQIEGPPGSGKSQTIVNIVADALQQKKKVAVVCDHVAALDVVRKRLKGINLDGLAVQITSPKENRTAVIQKARDIEDELIICGNRVEICDEIERAEESCERRSAAFSPDPYQADKTRGHCLAKIDAAKRTTNFDAHFTENKAFIKNVSKWLRSHPNEKTLLGTVKDIAGKWCDCDYPNHLWKDVDITLNKRDDDELRSYFGGAIERIASLNPRNLPNHDVLAYAAHPLVFKFYLQVTNVVRHDTLKLFSDIIKYTREAFNYAGIQPCPALWKSLHESDIAKKKYEEYRDTIVDIPDIVSIKRAIQENKVIQVLSKNFSEQPKHWAEIVEVSTCKLHLSTLPRPLGIKKYNREKAILKEALETKKIENAKELLCYYDDRKAVSMGLKQQRCLRLRRGRQPATMLRELYQVSIRSDMWKMFPVLLTNPSSVSQIMPLDLECIDLLVIDEASQMFTADAMPLFYRSKRVIISGDQHQMPPSNFFALSEDDDDGDDQENVNIDVPYDLLEAVSGCAGEISSLGVHYRSRPAELIDFSNHAFYKGKLQVAKYNGNPPSFLEGRPIYVEHINDGDFKDGKNEQEANAIIDWLKKITNENSNLSVGIIVFNATQCNLVQEKLDEEAENDQNFGETLSRLRNLKSDGEDVGLFVRSVEHVQGDERDVIILGTTYGKKYRNYGPISKSELGRRRLNVAITRAKMGMAVITSLAINEIASAGDRPDDAGEARGSERWYLWKYMQYAQAISDDDSKKATDILREFDNRKIEYQTGREPENEFEKQIGDFLRENNFHVDYQVGEGFYRIDIGVKNNEGDSSYLCGVECDGRSHHSGWRAREKDISRQKNLESKGWHIERIWSDQWFSGNEALRQDFLDRVRRAVTLAE